MVFSQTLISAAEGFFRTRPFQKAGYHPNQAFIHYSALLEPNGAATLRSHFSLDIFFSLLLRTGNKTAAVKGRMKEVDIDQINRKHSKTEPVNCNHM